MSLSRAFAFAGVPSAVMSLWQVPDKATARLMVNYYKHLSSGLEKNEALRQAKIEFVRDNASMTEPYYWSGFILTGNNRPITFPVHSAWLLLATAAFVLMLLYAARKQMRRDVKPQSISSAPNA